MFSAAAGRDKRIFIEKIKRQVTAACGFSMKKLFVRPSGGQDHKSVPDRMFYIN